MKTATGSILLLTAALGLAACAGETDPTEDGSAGAAALAAGSFDTGRLAIDPRSELLAQRDGTRWPRELAGARADLAVRGVIGSNALAFDASLARQRAGVSARNAYWLARLSNMAYDAEPTLKTELAALGLTIDADHFQFFQNTCSGAEAFYVTNAPKGYADAFAPGQASPYFAALVFRGTEDGNQLDIAADVDAMLVRAPVGRVHEGFEHQLDSLWTRADARCGLTTALGPYLRQRHAHDGRKLPVVRTGADLYLSGHSLGGGLATLALATTATEQCVAAGKDLDDASCANVYTPVSAVVTFGSPRVGDPEWADWLGGLLEDRTAFYRWVNRDDIVPKMPAIMYRHVLSGDEEDFYRVQLSTDASLTIGVHGRIAPEGVPGGAPLASQVEDHRMKNYIAGLEKAAKR